MNVYVYGQLVGDKRVKKIGKNGLFNKWCLNNLIATCKKMNLDLFFTPYTKINSKWITNLM